MKVTRATLSRSLAVAAGLVFLASNAAMYAQVKTETSTTSGAATKHVRSNTGRWSQFPETTSGQRTMLARFGISQMFRKALASQLTESNSASMI